MSDWHQLVIRGPEETVRAFVLGFVAGCGGPAGVFGSALALEAESFGERLKRLFAAGSHHVFLAPARLAGTLAAALGERGEELEIGLEHDSPLESASFSLRLEAFSRPVADELRAALIRSVPPGVRIEGLSEAEETHPEARGPEPFAPLHEYIYRASGHVAGAFEGVLEMWRRARAHDCVEISAIRLIRRTSAA
jgi:hypothetical protein